MDHWVAAAVGFLAGVCLILLVRFDALRRMRRLLEMHRRLFHQSAPIRSSESAAMRPMGARK